MSRQNVPLLSFNRGLVSPKALGRVDLDRTRLSASVFTNFLAKSQGAMRIRPGTKYIGSSYNDTGAEFLEFVAATDDTALIELTHRKMRIWIDDTLLGRPNVTTSDALSDTGWSNTSTGGIRLTGSTVDFIPTMTSATTDGVTISATYEDQPAWHAADDLTGTYWQSGTAASATLPTQWKIDFGASNTKAVKSYSIRAMAGALNFAPSRWSLQRSDDNVAWVTEDTQGSEINWAADEKRTYTLPGADTGTVEARRYWRLNVAAGNFDNRIYVGEIEM